MIHTRIFFMGYSTASHTIVNSPGEVTMQLHEKIQILPVTNIHKKTLNYVNKVGSGANSSVANVRTYDPDGNELITGGVIDMDI